MDSMKCEAFLCCYFYAVLGWCGADPVQSEFVFVFRVSSRILIHDSRYCFAHMVFCSFCLGPVCASVILLHHFSVAIEANK